MAQCVSVISNSILILWEENIIQAKLILYIYFFIIENPTKQVYIFKIRLVGMKNKQYSLNFLKET